MRTTLAIALALVTGIGVGLAVSARAQEVPSPFLGSVPARTYTHSYKMSLDVGVDREWKPAERIDEERTRVHIPDLYGELVNVTPHGDAVVMWFKDEEGVVRNAVIPGVSERLLHVEYAPTRHIGYSYR